jgi:hypothetical protein
MSLLLLNPGMGVQTASPSTTLQNSNTKSIASHRQRWQDSPAEQIAQLHPSGTPTYSLKVLKSSSLTVTMADTTWWPPSPNPLLHPLNS